ncbi:MAG TPA: nucleoside 2-deoxyribosyltransferase [Eoetvoesiella sp.]
MKKIYLAGFDVFRPDALEYGKFLKNACREHGFEGLFPLDNAAPRDLAGADLAHWIYRANIGLIQQAHAVMANLNPFRGAEPDSGTVFEVGYAVALNKPVWVYTAQAGSLVQQVALNPASPVRDFTDAQGYTVEDFGMNLNLMIACSTRVVVGTAHDCLRQMRDLPAFTS